MIGIFDSGVGGLGIFQAITRLLPQEDLVYVAGNKYFPFGEKTPQEVQDICARITQFLIDKHDVEMIVIACNTATISSIAYLRSKFSIPFVGVVPVVKPACEQTASGCVAIMSTPLTACSPYLHDLIQKFGHGVNVLSIGCPGLVDLIESGNIETPEMEEALRALINPAIEQGADVIGLCCTHYPFIREKLQKIVGLSVTILDSNEPVARQVKRILSSERSGSRTANYLFYATNAEQFEGVARKLIGDVVVGVREVSL